MFLRMRPAPSVFDQFEDACGMAPWTCGAQARPTLPSQPSRCQRSVRKVTVPSRTVKPAPTPAGRIRIQQDAGFLKLLVDLPNFVKEDVKIEVDGHKLTIAAEKIVEATYTDGSGRVIHRERRVLSSFNRTLRLGDNIESESISAAMEAGVLTLTMKYKVPKAQGPRRVPIQGPSERSASLSHAQATSSAEGGPSTSQKASAAETPTDPDVEPAVEADAQDTWVEVNASRTSDEIEQREDDVSVPDVVADHDADDEAEEGRGQEAKAAVPAPEEKEEVLTEDGSVEECEY